MWKARSALWNIGERITDNVDPRRLTRRAGDIERIRGRERAKDITGDLPVDGPPLAQWGLHLVLCPRNN